MRNKKQRAEYMAQWRAKNPEKARAIAIKWREKNREHARAKTQQWREANRERDRANARRWRQNNPEQSKQHSREWIAEMRKNDPGKSVAITRKGQLKQQTPKWVNYFFIEEAYRLAALRSRMFGFKWEVDHVIPLKGDVVCGLHVENNLQVVPLTDNRSRGSKHWPDMPREAVVTE